MEDFTVAFTEANMAAFCNDYKLKAVIEKPTCFKNYMSSSCIDLFRTIIYFEQNFESTLTIETDHSDFHKLIVTVLKVKHEKVPPRITHCRDNKSFNLTRFFEKLQVRLTNVDINGLEFGSLEKWFMEFLNKVASLKTKFLRANHSKFISKEISKAIM